MPIEPGFIFGRSVAFNTVRAEVTDLLGNDIKKVVWQVYTPHDIGDILADVGVSVLFTRLEALFDKTRDLEPIRAEGGFRKVISPSAPPPDGVGEMGEHGSTGGT